ncbi:MAG: fused MFS/spermidine synthase, partial [Nitrosopumilus sp.]
MTALIYEIIWIRPLSLVFGTTTYAVSIIVASFILGLAIGSWVAGKFTDKLENPLKYFALIQIAVGFFGILLLPVFELLPGLYLNLYNLTYPNQSIFFITQILMSIAMITIPATLMGTTLPLMMKIYSKEITTVGKDVGKLDASNSVGAFFGTLAAGFLIIPILGIHDGILVTASINIILGVVILITKKYLNLKYVSVIIIVLIPLLIFYPSYDEKYLAGSIFLTAHYPTRELYDKTMEAQALLFYKESL